MASFITEQRSKINKQSSVLFITSEKRIFGELRFENSNCVNHSDLKMLDLEVVPERSLGCEHWEFILGKKF